MKRARLPIEIVAFAGCILEMLDARSHDCERELTILAALALAHAYLDDRGRSNKHWAVIEAAGLFEAQDVQREKTSILYDIDFGLLRISDRAVEGMVEEMQRHLPTPLTAIPCGDLPAASDKDDGRLRSLLSTSAGQAMWSFGVQTPEPSP